MRQHRTAQEIQDVAHGLFVLVGPDAAGEHLIGMFGWDAAFQALCGLQHERAGEAAFAAARELVEVPESPATSRPTDR